MGEVDAPYPATMDEIHDASILSTARVGEDVQFFNRGGDMVAEMQIKNPLEIQTKAIRRIGSFDYDYRDVLIKRWERPGQNMTRVADPAVVPTAGNTACVAWSPDGRYFAIGQSFSPRLHLYKRVGETFVRCPDATFIPINSVVALAWSPDGKYLLTSSSSTAEYRLFERIGDTLTHVAAGTSVLSALPAGVGGGLAWSMDGTYLAIVGSDSPKLSVFKRDTPTATTFTKLADPSFGGSEGSPKDLAWSPDGRYLITSGSTSPYVHIFKRTGDAFTKLPNPSVLPTANCDGVGWSLDGNYFAVGQGSAPWMNVYKRTGDTFTKLPNPDSLLVANATDVAWTPDGKHVLFSHTSGFPDFVCLTAYRLEDDVLIKVKSPAGSSSDSFGRDVDISPDGRYAVVAFSDLPTFAILKSALGPIEGAAVRIDPDNPYPG